MRAAAIIWAMQIPGLQVYLFRRQFPDLEKNHVVGPKSIPAILAPLIDGKWVQWNKSKYTFTFWNGSVIHLCHCQREENKYNYQGAEIHVLLIDELSQFTPTIYEYLRTRVRMVGIKIPENVAGTFPKILCGSNPGGPAHQFMIRNWLDVAPELELYQSKDEEGGMVRQFIPAKIADNPSLMEEDPNYPNRIRGMGNAQLVKAYLEGDFRVILGGMFDDLWDPLIHVIRPFYIPTSWFLDRSFDWGSSKPFSVGWWAETDGSQITLSNGKKRSFYPGTLIQFAEWYGWDGSPDTGIKMTATDIAKGIHKIETKMGRLIHGGPADASIFDDVNGNCISDDMEKQGIYWSPSDKGPGSRKLGAEQIRNRLRASLKYPMEEPGLFFFSNCFHSRRVLPITPRSDKDPESISDQFEDHPIDMIRYRCRGEKMRVQDSDFRVF